MCKRIGLRGRRFADALRAKVSMRRHDQKWPCPGKVPRLEMYPLTSPLQQMQPLGPFWA